MDTPEFWTNNPALANALVDTLERPTGTGYVFCPDDPTGIGYREAITRTEEREEWRHPNHVRLTAVRARGILCRVSTIFLRLDHSYFGGHVPILFETMVFVERCRPGALNRLEQDERWKYLHQSGQRYATIVDARRGHNAIVRALRAGQPTWE